MLLEPIGDNRMDAVWVDLADVFMDFFVLELVPDRDPSRCHKLLLWVQPL